MRQLELPKGSRKSCLFYMAHAVKHKFRSRLLFIKRKLHILIEVGRSVVGGGSDGTSQSVGLDADGFLGALLFNSMVFLNWINKDCFTRQIVCFCIAVLEGIW